MIAPIAARRRATPSVRRPAIPLALGLFLGTACEAPSPPPAPPPSQAAALGSAIVARVGDAPIHADQIARIAAAQNIPTIEARDLAVRDALLAAEAHARGIDADRQVELAASGVLARALVRDIAAAAEAQGPVTDAELDEITARHWTDLDRPDASRVVHALVSPKKNAADGARARASSLAADIRKAITPAIDAAQHTEPPADPRAEDPVTEIFRKAATSVSASDLDVRVEPLAPVVADGRTFVPGLTLDPAFAKAAVALTKRGDVSPVIETSFGFHVLLLLQRVPGETVPREERRAKVREEVMSLRARAAKEQLMSRLRPSAGIERNADATLALVPVDR